MGEALRPRPPLDEESRPEKRSEFAPEERDEPPCPAQGGGDEVRGAIFSDPRSPGVRIEVTIGPWDELPVDICPLLGKLALLHEGKISEDDPGFELNCRRCNHAVIAEILRQKTLPSPQE